MPERAHTTTRRGPTRREACAAALAWGAPSARAGSDAAPRWARGDWRGFTTDNIPALSAGTLRALAGTGARLARTGLRMQGVAGPSAPDAERLQALLDLAASLGLGLVVLGEFDGGGEASSPLWQDAARRQQFVQAWAAFARRLGGHAALAGIDLLNEPHPPMPDGTVAGPQRMWGELSQQAVRAIRDAGCAATIVVEPVVGAHPLGLRHLAPLADEGVVYSIHFYTPHDITHQQVSTAWPRRIPYPAGPEWGLGGWDPNLGIGRIDAQRLANELRPVREFQLQHGVPIYVGEFGCVRWAPDGSALRWVRDCLALFQAWGWSWSFHSFRTWPGWDPEIATEDPDARGRSTDAPMMRLLKAALARPSAT